MRIYIEFYGKNGYGCASFDRAEWLGMSAVARVLAIHDAARHITAGQPFDVIRETLKA